MRANSKNEKQTNKHASMIAAGNGFLCQSPVGKWNKNVDCSSKRE